MPPESVAALQDWEFEALGTRWVVSTPEPLDAATRRGVDDELERIDLQWSRFRDDSVVAAMSRRVGSYPFPPTDQPLVDLYRELYEITGGAVTPFVGDTLADAGYDASYSLRPGERIRSAPAWEDVLDGHTGEFALRTTTLIDVGAAGKGFAVDRVAQLVAAVTDDYIVDGSGDMLIERRRGGTRVALEHPLDPTRAIGVVTVSRGAICASASNRRAWADWHHIVDPRSTSPAREVLATWVVGPVTMIADGLATALFLVPPATLTRWFADGYGYLVIRRNGSVEHSDIPGLELFL